MSAEMLRQAASLMRERAEAALAGGAQWTGQHYWVSDYDPSDPSGQTAMQRLVGGMDAPDCDHYSSWHPAVALLVARLLDDTAETWEMCIQDAYFNSAVRTIAVSYTREHALNLARAYLGESS